MAVTSIANKLKSGSLLVGNAAYDPGTYYLIERVTVGSGGSSTITFSSIPSTYKHLQLRMIARSTQTGSGNASNMVVKLNSDTGSNYTYHYLTGNGSSVSAAGAADRSAIYMTFPPKNSETSGIFGSGIIDILDYANTNKYKTLRTLNGYDANGSGEIYFESFLWRNTSAINEIVITSDLNNMAQYSSFALYGIKGA